MTSHRTAVPVAAILLCIGAACTSKGALQPHGALAPVPAAAGRGDASGLANQSVEASRLLVRRAALDVVADDVARASARAQSVLVSAGGYVERGERSEHSASFTLRVPEATLDAVLDSLSTLGRVASRTVSAQDVTEQAIDLDARLQSLIATRERLRQLHDKANSVGDVLAVERELARVEGEVESLQGRVKHLRSSASLAEIELSVRQKVVLGPLGVVAQAIGNAITWLFVRR